MKNPLSRFRKNTEPPTPGDMRRELMGQKLPADKLGEIATLAAARVADDETIPPEVAAFAGDYVEAFRNRIDSEAARLGEHALLDTMTVMITAGVDMRAQHGNPLQGDFVHDSTGLADGANATDARLATEHAMGQIFYDMTHPPKAGS